MTETMPDPRIDQAAEFARQNDAFRRHVCLDAPYPADIGPLEGRLVCTPSVYRISLLFITTCQRLIGTAEAFPAGNDPEGHHEFGAVTVGETRIFWKIDAYDRAYEYGSEDPSDPVQTARVLTIMLPSDW